MAQHPRPPGSSSASRAAESSFPFREVAVELLGADDDAATRDLLLKLLDDARALGRTSGP